MKHLLVLVAVVAAVSVACGSDTTASVGSGDTPVSDDDPVNGDEPGQPNEPVGGPFPVADLTITYEHPDVGTLEYRIVCLGDTATLMGTIGGVDETSACLALSEPDVATRLVEGAPVGRACTEIYGGPETAHIVGSIDDQPVATSVDRANGCGIADWDDLLADLLPEPRPFT